MSKLKELLKNENFKQGVSRNRSHEYFVKRSKTIVVWYFLFIGISSNVLVIEYDNEKNGEIRSAIVENHMI